VPTRLQGVEIGDAVAVEHHGLAVDDELLMAALQRRYDNPRIAVGPVVAAAGDQAQAIPVALQSCSQSGPDGTLADLVGRQKSKRMGLCPNIAPGGADFEVHAASRSLAHALQTPELIWAYHEVVGC